MAGCRGGEGRPGGRRPRGQGVWVWGCMPWGAGPGGKGGLQPTPDWHSSSRQSALAHDPVTGCKALPVRCLGAGYGGAGGGERDTAGGGGQGQGLPGGGLPRWPHGQRQRQSCAVSRTPSGISAVPSWLNLLLTPHPTRPRPRSHPTLYPARTHARFCRYVPRGRGRGRFYAPY